MTNITYNNLSDFLRHANNGANETEFDSNIDSPIIISQIELSSQIADYLNEEILEETQVEAIDILDVLASLGIVLSSLAKDVHRHNYASIAHSYAINPNILPEISQHLS